ncbi:MAG TPA: hypothetical protein DCS43_07310, partial [Verrucomicrobia bacterium]|nr:hypothetical protein [Verrucomicrobiota bacterium]
PRERLQKMFGEYGLYCDGTIEALICNDQLFIKPTEAGRSFIKHAVEAPPYPGGCPWSSERHDGPRIAGVITPINLKAKKGQSI